MTRTDIPQGSGQEPSPCFCYIRVSSGEQEEEGFSLQAQERLLREYVESKGFEVVQLFRDVETSKEPGRTAFNAMVDSIRTCPEVRMIVVEKTDRLYRNIRDWVTLDELDLEIHFVKEGSVISKGSRSSEKFVHGIKVLMAKNYVDNLSEETRKGMLEKARQGYWPSYAPIGYVNTKTVDDKRIITPDAERAPIIRALFLTCALGDSSLSDLGKLAREMGLTLRMKRGRFGKSAVQKILRNRIYCGEVEWAGETYEGKHEPIVSKSEWLMVQDVLEGRVRTHGAQVKREFAYARMITCTRCGGLMTGRLQKGTYVYYHCNGHHGKCHEPYVREEILTDAYSEVMKSLNFSEHVAGVVVSRLEKDEEEWIKYKAMELSSLRMRESELKLKLSPIYDKYVEGRIPEWFFEQKRDEILGHLERVQAAIARLELREGPDIPRVKELLELARSAYQTISTLNPTDRRRLLQTVVLNSSWGDGRLHVTFRKPFDSIAYASEACAGERVSGMSESELVGIWLPGEDLNLEPSG